MDKLLQHIMSQSSVSNKMLPHLKKAQQGKGFPKETLKDRQYAYKTIRPSDYFEASNYMRFLFNNEREEFDDPRSEEAFRMYLGLEQKPKYFTPSQYRPTIKPDPKAGQYYKVDQDLEQEIFNSFKDKVKLNQIFPASETQVESYFDESEPGVWEENGRQYKALVPGDKNMLMGRPMVSNARALGNFVVSRGKDDNGEYLSYSDQYDFPDLMQKQMKGQPYKIYGRVYYPKDKKQTGGPIVDPRGQWAHPGQVTRIPSSNITMQGVDYPVLGVGNNGQSKMMYPGKDYDFGGASYVDEYPMMANGGYTVSRSSERKGKTHKVTGPDGTVKYFGDSKLGQHPKDPERKKAFYARHKKNLAGNPFFRAFARKTWEEGGTIDMMSNGGGLLSESVTCSSCGHSWKSVEGGLDPLTCHKCGGIVEMQNGGNLYYDNQYIETMKSNYETGGQMIRRADGSYSRRGLWDNIRANKGSGKKPSKEMLEQERKIKAKEMKNGGTNNPGFDALPPYVQAKILSNMGLGGYYDPYMEAGGSTFSGNAFYGNGGYYPMYAEGGPGDPNGRWHGEWADDYGTADQYNMYNPSSNINRVNQNGDDEYYDENGQYYPGKEANRYFDRYNPDNLDVLNAANVEDTPMMIPSIRIVDTPRSTPKSLPGKKGQDSGSLVNYLNANGEKSDYATRKSVAENVYGFENYRGTAEQNKMLLEIIKTNKGSNTGSSSSNIPESVNYNPNDGNMLRTGWNQNFDSRATQYGPPRPGVPLQKQAAPIQKNGNVKVNGAVNNKTAGKINAANSKDAEEAMTFAKYKANDPYFFATQSDPGWIKTIDAPFTYARDLGARMVYDKDPVAFLEAAGAGLLSKGPAAIRTIINAYKMGNKSFSPALNQTIEQAKRRAMISNNPMKAAKEAAQNAPRVLRYIDPSKSAQLSNVQRAAQAAKKSPGTVSAPRMRALPTQMRKQSGGPVIGQEMDVTPQQLEMLRAQGFDFEII